MFCTVSVTVMLKQLVYRISGTLVVTDSVTVLILLVEETAAGVVCSAKNNLKNFGELRRISAIFQPNNG